MPEAALAAWDDWARTNASVLREPVPVALVKAIFRVAYETGRLDQVHADLATMKGITLP